MATDHIPPDYTLILTCGPRPMIAAVGSILQQHSVWIDYKICDNEFVDEKNDCFILKYKVST